MPRRGPRSTPTSPSPGGGTELGTFRIRLRQDLAPRTVANFIGLATGSKAWIDPATGAVREGVPYYDGLIFHRLIHTFMIQGGDPLGTGSSGPGYIFQDEFDPALRHDGAYVVSMANSGVNSNGSQFFITFGPAGHLDDLHSVFGTVIDDAAHPGGRALIDSLTSTADFPTDANDRPLTPIVMDSVVISGPDLAAFDPDDPAHGLPVVERQWMRLERRGEQSFLVWERRDRTDAPVRFSTGLETWSLAGNVLGMGPDALAEVEVSALAGASGTTFFSYPRVDYTHTPVLPPDLFTSGATVDLDTGVGILNLTFNGAGEGSWRFTDTGGLLTVGAITSTFVPSGTQLPGIPATGQFIPPSGTYARALSAREVTVYFDAPVGPHQWTAIRPSLSFHTDTTGWFTGPVLSNLSQPPPFKGTFSWAPAP